MSRKPVILKRADWASHDSLWKGNFEGKDIGTNVTVLFYATQEVAVGPRWHVHPYDEIFIMRKGRALFTIGDEKIEAEAARPGERAAQISQSWPGTAWVDGHPPER